MSKDWKSLLQSNGYDFVQVVEVHDKPNDNLTIVFNTNKGLVVGKALHGLQIPAVFGSEKVEDTLHDVLVSSLLKGTLFPEMPIRHLLRIIRAEDSPFLVDTILMTAVEGTSVKKDSFDLNEWIFFLKRQVSQYVIYVSPSISHVDTTNHLLNMQQDGVICARTAEAYQMWQEKTIKSKNVVAGTSGRRWLVGDMERIGQDEIAKLVETAWPEQLLSDRFTLIHNGIKPENIIRSPNGLYLIDWSRAIIGTPIRDIAALIHTAYELGGEVALRATILALEPIVETLRVDFDWITSAKLELLASGLSMNRFLKDEPLWETLKQLLIDIKQVEILEVSQMIAPVRHRYIALR